MGKVDLIPPTSGKRWTSAWGWEWREGGGGAAITPGAKREKSVVDVSSKEVETTFGIVRRKLGARPREVRLASVARGKFKGDNYHSSLARIQKSARRRLRTRARNRNINERLYSNLKGRESWQENGTTLWMGD